LIQLLLVAGQGFAQLIQMGKETVQFGAVFCQNPVGIAGNPLQILEAFFQTDYGRAESPFGFGVQKARQHLNSGVQRSHQFFRFEFHGSHFLVDGFRQGNLDIRLECISTFCKGSVFPQNQYHHFFTQETVGRNPRHRILGKWVVAGHDDFRNEPAA
jgi:hypothetical protein